MIESTAKFRARDQAALHLKGGARKVLLSAPGVVPTTTGAASTTGQAIPELANEAFERAAAGTMADLTVIAGDRQ